MTREWKPDDVLRRRVEEAERERDSAQEHLAYHLRDFAPGADMAATGDLAVDMASFAGRMRARAERAERALAVARREALRDAADAWMHGEWANHMVTASDPAQIRIGSANRFGEWLRDRADRIGGDA